MRESQEEFLHRANVANYKRQLAIATDEVQRRLLVKLLADEASSARDRGWAPVLP